MIQFFAPDIKTNPVLPENDSQHCIRVLRMKAGDEIEVIDGAGSRYRCRIVDPHSKHTLVEILDSVSIPNPWGVNITVGVAPTKNIDRMEWMVEKLTEIGINRIVPLLCHRSERREIKSVRLEKIGISAMKQSLKTYLPQIDQMTPIEDFVKSQGNVQKFVAYCADEFPKKLLAKEIKPSSDVTILVGPEGDFTPSEIELTINSGFIPVTLGDCRLRTETAAIAAVQTIHTINQLYS